MLWVPSPSFDTATFCVGALEVGMRTRVTHGIASSTGICIFLLAFLNNGVKFFSFVGEKYRDFSSSDVQLEFWVHSLLHCCFALF